MSDLGVNLDKPYAQAPEALALAVKRVSREAEADMLLAMLGLVEADPAPTGPPGAYRVPSGLMCRTCRHRTRTDGVCRRSDCHRGDAP